MVVDLNSSVLNSILIAPPPTDQGPMVPDGFKVWWHCQNRPAKSSDLPNWSPIEFIPSLSISASCDSNSSSHSGFASERAN